jgi:hypothetical protein
MMATLKLAGREIPARDTISPGAQMRLAKAMQSSTPDVHMAGLYDFLVAMVLPEHRRDLDTALDEIDSFEEIEKAGGDLMAQLAGRPTEAASSSQDGQPTTEPTSRVVSLSQGTSRTETAASDHGRSEAG